MIVAVTGATGFLGSHLTRRLLDAGHRIRALARDAARAAPIADRVDAVVVGDIADPAPLDELMAGADSAVHLVSNFRTVTDTTEQTTRTNFTGTVEALAAAERAGVRRFVHCSTIGVHGDVRSTPADESTPYNPGDDYQRTKRDAEGACKAAIERGRMEVVVVRPCSIYGPGDLRMLKMFQMLAKRRFVTLGRCQENFHAVYVDDLVEGFLLALETPGIAGETFIVGGERYVSLREYLLTAADAVGAPPPWIRLPYRPMYVASVICEGLCSLFGVTPPLHPRRAKFFRNNRAFSIQKARRVLGYEPRVGLVDGMARTVAWYREHGHL